MKFYIGSTINEIDEQGANVEFSDELLGFIYKHYFTTYKNNHIAV